MDETGAPGTMPPPVGESGTMGSEGGGRFSKAKEFVGEKYGAAADAMKNRYTAVRGKVEEIDMGEVTGKVREYVRSNPGKAMLISVGVGFLIGLLLRRSDED